MVEKLQGDVFHCKGKSIESKIEGTTRFKAALSFKKNNLSQQLCSDVHIDWVECAKENKKGTEKEIKHRNIIL